VLIQSRPSQRSTCLIVGIVVAVTFVLACLVLAIALSLVSLPDLGSGEQASNPTSTISSGGETLVAVLDVDQGQAVLIVAPDGSAALIDAGRSQTRIREEIAPYVRALGVTELDYLILSHPDQDHVGGMPAVLELFPVANWVDPGIPTTNQTYEETIEIVLDEDIPAILARQGEKLSLGGEVTLSLLWPAPDLILSGSDPDSNENSAVVQITVGQIDILVTGDLEDRGEHALIDQLGADLASEVLVVGHHGSRSSSTADFLDAVDPQVALISVGEDNPYGHPHDEVLQRLRFRSVDIYRTDLDGTIEVRTDGSRFELATVETDTER
jgi:competence protein ComEC